MVLGVNSQASIFPLQLKKQSLLVESVVVKSVASGYVGGEWRNFCVLQYSHLKNREDGLILYYYIFIQVKEINKCRTLITAPGMW